MGTELPFVVSESAVFFFSSRRRHTRCGRDWSSDVCSSDLNWTRTDPGGGVGSAGLRRRLHGYDREIRAALGRTWTVRYTGSRSGCMTVELSTLHARPALLERAIVALLALLVLFLFGLAGCGRRIAPIVAEQSDPDALPRVIHAGLEGVTPERPDPIERPVAV